MKKALIHIGSSKTGSTSIQRALSFREYDSAVSFPIFECWEQHNPLLLSYYSRENWTDNYVCKFWNYSDSNAEKWTQGYRKRWLHAIRNAGSTIVSSEMMFNYNNEAILRFKQDFIDSGYDEFLVVVYIRRPSDHYRTLVPQLLQNHINYVLPDHYNYNIKDSLLNWSKAFPGSVECRKYESIKDDRFNVVDDFFDIADSFFSVELDRSNISIISNPTLPVEALILSHQFRTYLGIKDLQGINRQYEKFLIKCRNVLEKKNIQFTRPELKQKVAFYVDYRHRRDIEYLIDEYGLDVQDWLVDRKDLDVPGFDRKDFLSILTGYSPEALDKLTFLLFQKFIEPDYTLKRLLGRYLRKKVWQFRKFLKTFIMMNFGR